MGLLRECPYVVGLRGLSEDARTYVIYMDLAEHGELFSRVIEKGSLQEHEAQPWFLQLVLAVQHMHAHGVVHRDLKLENILLDGQDLCKVCDFGLAHQYSSAKEPGKFDITSLKEVCGSKSYCAPEVLEGRGYEGFPTDVWSCGICLFAMLAGFFPLDEASGSDWRFGRVKMAADSGMSTCHTICACANRNIIRCISHVHACTLSSSWPPTHSLLFSLPTPHSLPLPLVQPHLPPDPAVSLSPSPAVSFHRRLLRPAVRPLKPSSRSHRRHAAHLTQGALDGRAGPRVAVAEAGCDAAGRVWRRRRLR